MDIHKVYKPILTHFRRRRMQHFAQLFSITERTTVLDLGGGPFNWSLLEARPKLTVLDINSETEGPRGGIVYVREDGCNTSFPDKSFDVVFSNSVIEHVGDVDRQRKFARECMRCGSGFYVQTPNKWFPVDPHTFLLFVHWLPKKVFNTVMWISPRFLISRPSEGDIADFRNMRLLSKRDLQELFPGAEIIQERFCGMTKSLIAVSRNPLQR
jgi:SAM-dependent methyltransferase